MLTPNNSKPGGFKLKSRWLNRSEQDLSDISGKSPTPAPVSVSTPLPSTPNSYQANDVSSSSSSGQEKMVAEPVNDPPQVKMPSFDRIVDNIFLMKEGNKAKSKESKRMICECTLPEDGDPDAVCCGSDCLNRILYIECGSKCRCGDRCTNRRFQKHEYAFVEPFPAGAKGWGLRAVSEIPKHTFVMEYVGEVLSAKKFRQRTKQYARDPSHRHHYFMALRSDEVIDATQKGNVSRFINHSCQPNCETQKWTVEGRLRIGFFTIDDIAEGEELTFDYRFQRYGKEAQKCYCGTSACRGFIGGESPPIATTQRREISRQLTKKKRAPQPPSFEDMLFDQELSDLLVVGALKTRDQVITYCRLMVRAEDVLVRMQLIDLLNKTGESCLRLFLDHHGCQLLWSWMVDDQKCHLNWTSFQLSVLNILKRLPIPHRNMVEDSRLITILQRWSKDPSSRLVKHKAPPPSDEEVIKDLLADLVNQIVSDETPGTSEEGGYQQEIANGFEEPLISREKEVMQLAEAVLAQWANLKENFRIPKKIAVTSTSENSKSEVSSATTRRNSSAKKRKRVSSSGKRDRSRSSSLNRRHKRARSRTRSRSRSYRSRTRSRSRSRSRGPSSRHARYPRRSRSPVRSQRRDHHNNKWKHDTKRTPERLSSVVVAAPADERAKKTKEERRREFEAAVLKQQQEEESKKRMEMQMVSQAQSTAAGPVTYSVLGAPGVFWPAPGVSGHSASVNGATLPAHIAASVADAPTAGMAGAALALMVFDSNTCRYWWQEQVTKVLIYPADERQVAAFHTGDYSVAPHFYHDPATGLIHEVRAQPAANVISGVDDLDEVDMACDDDSGTRESRIATLKQEISTLQQQLTEKQAELRWLLEHDEVSSVTSLEKELPSGWKATRDEEGHIYYYHGATKRTQWEMPTADDAQPKPIDKPVLSGKKPDRHSAAKMHKSRSHHIKRKVRPEPVKRSSATVRTKTTAVKAKQEKPIEPPVEKVDVKVNVKVEPASPAAVVTVEEAPNTEVIKEEENEKRSLVSTPLVEPASAPVVPSATASEDIDPVENDAVDCTPHGTTMMAADTSSEVAKKLKENFKGQVSNHVIKYLSPYRKPDCKVGRITSNEDFKHLARKLTHAVMEKELKHCTRLEDLRVTESVLHKAKDYVRKYMSKIGQEYKRTTNSP